MTVSSLSSYPPDLPELDDWHPDMLPAPPVLDAGAEARMRRTRSAAWREALRAGVISASPALLDMAAVRGVDLARAGRRLRPPVCWFAGSALPAFDRWEDVWDNAPGPKRRHSPWGRLGRTPQAPRVSAVPPSHPDGSFVVALDGAALSGCARVGGAELLTHGGMLQVWFEQPLPDTVMMAVVGRVAGHVVDHSILTGRPYPIVGATRVRSWTVLEVRTGLVQFSLHAPKVVRGAGGGNGS